THARGLECLRGKNPEGVAGACIRKYRWSRSRSQPEMTLKLIALLCLAQTLLEAQTNSPFQRKYSNIERLELKHLKAAHEDAQKIRLKRSSFPLIGGLNDYRCILHAHAEDSA